VIRRCYIRSPLPVFDFRNAALVSSEVTGDDVLIVALHKGAFDYRNRVFSEI
jgi:hypothetical protein